MIQQKQNQSVRLTDNQIDDIEFLRLYFKEHGSYPLFKQVLLETRTDCNNHCPFCPHAFVGKELGVMSWECYTTIIDQLYSIGYNGRVALMLSNEPLLDDRLTDRVSNIL